MRIFMHRAVHLVLTLVMVWLAFLFIDPTPSFKDASGVTYATFLFMSHLATEQQWGFFCLSVGLVGIGSMFSTSWPVRTIAAGILSASHLVIATLIFLGNPHATGSGLFLGYAILGGALAYSTAHLGERIKADLDPPDFPRPLAG